jgi:hypothetical protein
MATHLVQGLVVIRKGLLDQLPVTWYLQKLGIVVPQSDFLILWPIRAITWILLMQVHSKVAHCMVLPLPIRRWYVLVLEIEILFV